MFKFSWIIIMFSFFRTFEFRRLDDICSHHHARRLYLDLGESGILTARNITFNGTNRGAQQHNKTTSHEQCLVEIITCPSCVLRLVFRHLNLSHTCDTENLVMDNPCRCDYVWISEPPYEQVSGVPYCGAYVTSTSPDGTLSYVSKTRTISISLIYNGFHSHAFSLDYTSERNWQYFIGSPPVLPTRDLNSSGLIISPFFPNIYPRDLVIEYIITCAKGNNASLLDPNCRIRVIFSDFQVSPVSTMEFYDYNHQRIEVAGGTSFRPPVILSSGPSLTIRFFANGGNGIGYKAMFSFISGNFIEKTIKPITDCGGFVEDFGGAITMMNMVDQGVKAYDCLWLIRPPENFLHLKTHLYLKVVSFMDFAGSTELQIRQGLTSELSVLETLRYPVSQISSPNSREHVISVSSGFYVSLRGSFGPSSRLAITYASFSYNKCFAGSEFLCQNHRCITGKLSCDGFDHCGDGSDEPVSCYQEWEVQTSDRRWNSHTPNYYFPKIERYSDLKMATLLFVVSSIGLILLISALIILLYRMGSRARQQRDLQNRLQTISELLDDTRIEEMVTSDDPPRYEPPPDYDDVMKPPSSSKMKKKKRKSNISGGLSSSLGRTDTMITVSTEEGLDSEPKQLLLPIPQLLLHESQSSIVSQSMSTASHQPTPLPDSPPPPYSAKNEIISLNRVASEGDIATLTLDVVNTADNLIATNPDGELGTYSWFTSGGAAVTSHSREQKPETDENISPDTSVLNRCFPRRSLRRLRRCQSCSNHIMLSKPENFKPNQYSDSGGALIQNELQESLDNKLNESMVAVKAKECIQQLNEAIESQLQNLLISNIRTQTSSPSMSATNTDSETCYFSSLDSSNSTSKSKSSNLNINYWVHSTLGQHPFESFAVNLDDDKTKSEIITDGEQVDDKYWEEFDKQFQNPERKVLETQRSRKKVSDLSKKFDCSFIFDGKKGDESINKATVSTSQDEVKGPIITDNADLSAASLCECQGACGCATSYKFKHFQPIRRKKIAVSCKNLKTCESENEEALHCSLESQIKTV